MMQNKFDGLSIAGISLNLKQLSKNELTGVLIDDIARYSFYMAEMAGIRFILLESKMGENETPANCEKSSERLSNILGYPIVYYFTKLKFYERARYIQKTVYFITEDGDIFLPNMILTSKSKDKKTPKKLSAAAQYLLLYHLQVDNLNGLSVTEITELVSRYSYVSIAKAVQVLEELKLCIGNKDNERNKRIIFEKEGLSLWKEAKPYLSSPVKEVKYCDALPQLKFQYSGVSALEKYSSIAPDDNQTISVYVKDFRKDAFLGLNEMDGKVKVELWRYPEIIQNSDIVDRLSLFLSLENDPDPRVDKENKSMFEKIWQTPQ